ncbi:hypothetical protein EIK77_001060 [Talaromyces pinophilus]|nr:hypothetical protein EIK77_001060 [Talaromyces pinophilus]
MFISTLVVIASLVAHVRCGTNLCSFPFPAGGSSCDVSQSNVCCSNLDSDTCCSFDGQDGTNTHLGGSVLVENLPDEYQAQAYGPAIPGGQGSCSAFLGSLRYDGCISFGNNRAGSANYFYSPRKRSDITAMECVFPDKATYVNESGFTRHIAIPTGNYSMVAKALKENDYGTLSQFEDFGENLYPAVTFVPKF